MATQSTTKGKGAKAGGQRGFEDKMRDGGIKPTLQEGATPDDEDEGAGDEQTESTENDETGNDESTDMDTSNTESETGTGADITAQSVLTEAGIDPETATDGQTTAAEEVVEKVREGTITMDSLKASLEGIVAQKPDGEESAPESMSNASASAAMASKTPTKGCIPAGHIMTQPALLAAILQAKTIYTQFKFGNCTRWFKIAKKEAQQCAHTVQAFEKPEAHGLQYFGTLEDDCLFIGERG